MNDEWGTPDWLYYKLNNIYHFDLDIAAKQYNAKCQRFLVNAFKDQWSPTEAVWCNPPYSNGQIERWLNLIITKKEHYWRCIVLLPVDTSTNWFHYYRKYTELILFINQRLSFKGAESSARFASMLFIFGKDILESEEQKLKELGSIWKLK